MMNDLFYFSFFFVTPNFCVGVKILYGCISENDKKHTKCVQKKEEKKMK